MRCYNNSFFTKFPQFLLATLLIFCFACKEDKPSVTQKIIAKPAAINSAVEVQLQELLRVATDTNTTASAKVKTYNTQSLKNYFSQSYKPVFTSKMTFTEQALVLKKFIDEDCKTYGLFPEAYHTKGLDTLFTKLQNDSITKMNAEEWAKAELLLTDAYFQIVKHVKHGRLYTDTSNKYYDSTFTKNYLQPSIQNFIKEPNTLDNILQKLEPKIKEYDSLKLYLKNNLASMQGSQKQFSTLNYTLPNDSIRFVKAFIKRLQEEGYATEITGTPDSIGLDAVVKDYQTKHAQTATGIITKDMVAAMNTKGDKKFQKIALAMDKFKGSKIENTGNYVIVNIPSYYLRAYKDNMVVLESKVAVGRTSTKTPVMESEISDIIVMPRWFVPPSILKIPGYIDRHRNNPNFIVRGNKVIQKSGPGNALGNMKFNFKSGEAIYLHDTNEKGVFGSNYRAASHGCVRVQDYVKLASYLSTVSPICEKNYKKVENGFTIDSVKNDTNFKFKYVVKDSVIHKDDVIPNMVKRKSHHEISVLQKIPIYIKYYTCAIKNGEFVLYNDVYGYDKSMVEKYFTNYL